MLRTTFDGPRSSTWVIDEPTTRRERVRGAKARPWTSPQHGMLFERCRSVHTFGMPAPIAVVALNARLEVERVTVLRPRRLFLPRPGIRHILECATDADVRPGDRFGRTTRSALRRDHAIHIGPRWPTTDQSPPRSSNT
jgi:hypothetical protein